MAKDKLWIVIDFEQGKAFRFRWPSLSPKAALNAYISHLNPELTIQEINDARENFSGEIFDANDLQDIVV